MISTWPPSTLWRTALSTRFEIRRSISAGSPSVIAGSRSASRVDAVLVELGPRRSRPPSRARRYRCARAARARARCWRASAAPRSDAPGRARRQQLLAGGAQRLRARVRVGERHLQQRALDRERRAQLVRGVGDEAPLRVERRLQPRQQIVERLPQLRELVARPASASRSCRLPAEIVRARAVISRSGAASDRTRTSRAGSPPAPSAPARSRRPRAAGRCRRAAAAMTASLRLHDDHLRLSVTTGAAARR